MPRVEPKDLRVGMVISDDRSRALAGLEFLLVSVEHDPLGTSATLVATTKVASYTRYFDADERPLVIGVMTVRPYLPPSEHPVNEYDLTMALLTNLGLALRDLSYDLEKAIRGSIRHGEPLTMTTFWGSDGRLYGGVPKKKQPVGPTIEINADMLASSRAVSAD